MNQEVRSHYSIQANTMALLPAKDNHYNSIVLETNRQLYVQRSQIEIIKQSCLDRYTTYEGVRDAVKHYTGFTRKVPIPINPFENIYFFPTHATDDYACCWISYYQIHQIQPTSTSSSNLTFKNGESVQLSIPPSILKNQMKRTLESVYELVRYKKKVQYS